MKRVLREKLRHLICGDDGAAMVITLGVFFFMYIFCAGVYAVGMAVKEKILLQNACDAAAYSAAVVQADTISRIATLNRAMGWTYAQMCRRQMDYIVYRWLQHTVEHYDADVKEAREWADKGTNYKHEGVNRYHGLWEFDSCGNDGGNDGDNPFDDNSCPVDISLNADSPKWDDGRWYTRDGIVALYQSYGDIGNLEEQIYQDKETIRRMNEAYDDYINHLPTHVDDAVSAILQANVPAYMTNQCRYVIKQEEYPQNLFLTMSSSDERTFCKWVDSEWKDEWYYENWDGNGAPSVWDGNDRTWKDKKYNSEYYGPFGRGSLSWYRLNYAAQGIQRSYAFNNGGVLCAYWKWRAWYCSGCNDDLGENDIRKKRHFDPCAHSVGNCFCSIYPNEENKDVWHHSYTYADAQDLMDRPTGNHDKNVRYYYTGEVAKPRKLSESYFGPRGTITVGLARQNTNPFFSVFRSAMEQGFYSAFRPYNDWTWCFSSAKAGYKLFELPERETAENAQDMVGWEAKYNGRAKAFNDYRDYCIDWKQTQYKRSPWVWIHMEEVKWRWVYVRDNDGNLMYDEDGRPKKTKERYLDPHDSCIYLPTEGEVENYRRHHTALEDCWYIVRDGTVKTMMGPGEKPRRKEYETYWRQSWNLTQSDWDAVLLPVRQGGAEANEVRQGGSENDSHLKWMISVRDGTKFYSYEPVWEEPYGADDSNLFVYDLVNSTKWKTLDGGAAPAAGSKFGKMLAGGNHDPDPDGVWGANYGETSAKWNGWWDIASTAADHPASQREKVQCKWNIGKPNAELDWKKITNLMFH